jgi:acetoacetyl-CoA synthetase
VGEGIAGVSVAFTWVRGCLRKVVKLAEGFALTDELRDKIRRTLRENASPRHVPALILETPDIPYTLNMKKVESAVTNLINGRAVSNKDALINPTSLDFYEQILPELQSA